MVRGHRRRLPVDAADARALFVFIGADPCTGWLATPWRSTPAATCSPAPTRWPPETTPTGTAAAPLLLETHRPGVFAVGRRAQRLDQAGGVRGRRGSDGGPPGARASRRRAGAQRAMSYAFRFRSHVRPQREALGKQPDMVRDRGASSRLVVLLGVTTEQAQDAEERSTKIEETTRRLVIHTRTWTWSRAAQPDAQRLDERMQTLNKLTGRRSVCGPTARGLGKSSLV